MKLLVVSTMQSLPDLNRPRKLDDMEVTIIAFLVMLVGDVEYSPDERLS